MVSFQDAPAIIVTMLLIAVVGVATFLALDGLDDNLVANSAGANATDDIETGVGNIFDLAPTWGTLVGVGILLGIVASFVFLGAVGYSYAKRRGYM